MKTTVRFFWVILCFVASAASADPVVIAGTNRVDRLAAEEFCRYYEQMTGRRPCIAAGEDSVVRPPRPHTLGEAAGEGARSTGVCAAGENSVVRPPRPHTLGAAAGGGARSTGAPRRADAAAAPLVRIGRSFARDLSFDPVCDSYRIRSVVEGGVTNLVLAGGNDRATMYAVYDFFERNGCRWFWDGDVVPRVASLPLGGYDVYEVSRFQYRATRYFAHRGLTRFQAEQWGLADWKREIDWLLKARLNVFFLRVGMDDLFQKAFPEYCRYPDASKPLPGQGEGYDNRNLFWSLEYRGKLRHDLQQYAFERGLIIPEDFGTITHWYTRTPEDFLKGAKPDFLPEPKTGYAAQDSGRVWDVRQDKWMDAYWKLTETSVREYGRPGYLHTIGFSERTMSTNRAENLAIKQATTQRMFDRALKAQPDAKIFFAGWDFHSTWTPEELKNYIPTLDPKHVVVWDYEWDAYRPQWKNGQFSAPTEWGLIGGKIPYTFGQFFYYRATFPHTDYALVAERFAKVRDDPACVGYILWPEASHTDILQLRDFTDNAWRPVSRTTDELVDAFCRDRYGDQAAAFAAIWKDVIPISLKAAGQGRWDATYGTVMIHTFANEPSKRADGVNSRDCWAGRFFPDADFAAAPDIFRRLAEIRWEEPMARRDAIDLARTVGDRLALDAFAKAMLAYFDWRDHAAGEGARSTEEVRARFRRAQAYVRLMARTLALHTDYSLCDSYDRLNAIEPIRFAGFGRTLLDNTLNFYCAAHQAELAAHVYVPMFDNLVGQVEDRLAKGDRTTPLSSQALRDIEEKVRETPLMNLRLTTPRTPAEYKTVMRAWFDAAGEGARSTGVCAAGEASVVRPPRPHTSDRPAGEGARSTGVCAAGGDSVVRPPRPHTKKGD